MALKIRLRRMGRKKAPTYRIVVAESSMPRDGRFVANLGHYNPRTNPATLVVDREKAAYWISKGATPTDTVQSLLRRAATQAAASPVEAVVETVKSTAKRATKAASGAASKATSAVRSAAAAAAETVGGAASAAAETVSDAASAAAEAVQEAASTVAETVQDAVEEVRERVSGRDEAEGDAEAPAAEGESEKAE